MSVPTNTVSKILNANFQDQWLSGLFDVVMYQGRDANGTTVLVERRVDLKTGRRLRRPFREAFLITDLPSSFSHKILSSTHTDSLAATVVRGDIIRGNSTPAWSRLAKGASATFLKMGATDPAWTTIALTDVAHGHTPNSAFAVGSLGADFTTSSLTDVIVTGLSVSLTGRNAVQGLRAFVGFVGGLKVSLATTNAQISIYEDGVAYITQPFVGVLGFIPITLYVPGTEFSDGAVHTYDVYVSVPSGGGSITVSGTNYTSFLFGMDRNSGLPIA